MNSIQARQIINSLQTMNADLLYQNIVPIKEAIATLINETFPSSSIDISPEDYMATFCFNKLRIWVRPNFTSTSTIEVILHSRFKNADMAGLGKYTLRQNDLTYDSIIEHLIKLDDYNIVFREEEKQEKIAAQIKKEEKEKIKTTINNLSVNLNEKITIHQDRNNKIRIEINASDISDLENFIKKLQD